jgi:hypothetical protein
MFHPFVGVLSNGLIASCPMRDDPLAPGLSGPVLLGSLAGSCGSAVAGRPAPPGQTAIPKEVPVPDQSQAHSHSHSGTAGASAAQIQLDEFIAVASRAALQVLSERQSALNPQPLPPGEAAFRPGGRIITGIVFELD